MTTVYENTFDANEWFVVCSLVFLVILVWIIPKIFSVLEGTFHFIYGVFIGMFYDHTISVKPWDFYDVNDKSGYQLIDFFSYLMYGPYSYFFIYLYVKLKIKRFMIIPYILIWTSFSVLVEYLGLSIGLFHYEKGYWLFWSIPIYMSAQLAQILFFHVIQQKEVNNKSRTETKKT
jgi:hypothetical protein